MPHTFRCSSNIYNKHTVDGKNTVKNEKDEKSKQKSNHKRH